jgi:hypothetical protein
MSLGMCSVNCDREPIWRFARNLLTYFAGTLIVGILVGLALSASACTWNPHVRCFSVYRDTFGVIRIAAEMFVLFALALAFLAAMIVQVYRVPAWWGPLIVVPLSVLGAGILGIGILRTGILPGRLAFLARDALFDPFTFVAVVSVLFAGYQFSLFIRKLIGKTQP